MLGTFRFFLAWLVMLSHLPNSNFTIGFNPGVSAVILFYFISGYLMYFSFNKIEQPTFFKKSLFFVLKRVFRLFPLYLIVLFSTILLISIYHHSTLIPLLNQDLTLKKVIINSMLIFNNYVFAPFEIHSLLPHPLIPPTWSLSTEWHYYLLVPLLFYIISKNFKYIIYFIIGISLIFELFAFTNTHLNSDIFGYRYIFGVLWIFLVGFLFAKEGFSSFLKFIYFFTLFYFIVFGFKFANNAYVKEITFAIFFSPFLFIIKNLNFKFDSILGNLSYPLFISHFFTFYFVENVLKINSSYSFFIAVFICLIIFSSILAFIHTKIYPFLIKKANNIL